MSLKWRLALTLGLLLLGLGLAITWAGRYASQLYFQEVNQTLNASLSMYVVDRLSLIEDGSVNENQFKQLAEQAMTVNPSVEVYLLDPKGHIVAHAMPAGSLLSETVPLAPVQAFLDGTAQQRLVLGSDPRSEQPKAFSASPITHQGSLQGYLYVVLGGSLFDQVQQTFLGSFIGRMAAVSLFVVLILGGVVGMYSLRRLTRPLEQLEDALTHYADSGFVDASAIEQVPGNTLEVQQLKARVTQMTDRLAEQFAQLETNDNLRRELLANISHDLRTPLASMQGYLETLLIKDAQLSTEERRKYLGIAHQHTNQLTRMVADLFELAKLDSGATNPEVETFPIAELLQDVIQEFSLLAVDKGVTLNGTNARSAITVSGDIRLLQRVLENLISNALRHTPAGGCIDIELQDLGQAVQVEVVDTGTGIAPEMLPNIFERYASGGEDHDGSGLGLAIVKRILELHDSQIQVTSKLNEGTRFSFALERVAA